MKALSKLQGAIIVQAAASDTVVSKFNENARMFVAAGVLIALTVSAGQARAQSEGVLTPSNCSMVGAVVGGTVGVAGTKSSAGHIIAGALGGLGGGALGRWLCSPRGLPAQDSSYESAASYGGGAGAVPPSTPKAALSITERERLDALSEDALGAKVEWKRALWNISKADEAGNWAARATAVEVEAQARQDFEQKRAAFSISVARMHGGSESVQPRAVGRYLEISGSMLELDTKSRTSYALLQSRDVALMDRSPAYRSETERSARIHKTL